MRSDFYVYLHRRLDNNEVFYVGKGTGKRASRKAGRNEMWTRVADKYGYSVEYVEKEISEESALDLEMELIKFYRECGHRLCNFTDGGEGMSGRSPTKAHELAVHRPVLCSNGMEFGSCKAAEIWLGNSPSSSKVSTCARRESYQANGFVWRFLDDCSDLKAVIDAGKDAFIEWNIQTILDKNKPKIVYCNNGMVFPSCSEAGRWLKSINHKIQTSYVSACCNGRKKSLEGFKFSFQPIFEIY